MSKVNLGTSWRPAPHHKKTNQGKTNSSIKLSSMNKSRKRSHKPSRGQG